MTVYVVNRNLLQGIALQSAGLQDARLMAKSRPRFHAELGEELATWREKTMGWTQEQVIRFARTKGLQIGMGALKSLETGKTKFPPADLLKALGAMYEIPYEELAARFFRANYGFDPIRHARDQQSGASSHVGAQANDTIASDRRELTSLRQQISKYKEEAGKVRALTDTLFDVAVDLRKASRAQGKRASGRGRHRKVS